MAVLARLAASQGGCVAIWQARRLGISLDRIARRVRDEGWTALHRSVVAMPGTRDDIDRQLWAAMLAVAELRVARVSAGPSDVRPLRRSVEDVVAITGWSAAERRGYERPPPAFPHLLVPHSVTTSRRGLRLIRSRRGIQGMWEWVDGMPVAKPVRVMWDVGHLGRGLTGAVDRVVDLAAYFDRTRQLAVVELLLMVEEPTLSGLPRRPPPILAAAATRLSKGYSHSKTEAAARRIATEVAAEVGVRLHPSPYPIRDHTGTIVAEADIAAPALRFDAEIDGPHHRGPLAAAGHRRRAARTDPLDWIVARYPVDEDTDELDEAAFRRQFRNDLRTVIALRERQAA